MTEMTEYKRKPYGRWIAENAPIGVPFDSDGIREILIERRIIDASEPVERIRQALWNMTSPTKHERRHAGFSRQGPGVFQYDPPASVKSERVVREVLGNPKAPAAKAAVLKQIGLDLKGRALLQDPEGNLFIAVPFGGSN